MKTKMKPCPDCEEGTYYVDTSRECTKTPWQECCGGCGYRVTCETCNGTAEIEDEDDIFSVGDKFKYLGLDAIVTNVEVSIYSGITYTIFIECSGVTLSVNSLSETLKNKLTMTTLQQLESALKDTPNLSELAKLKGQIAAYKLLNKTSGHEPCDKTALGELARAMQVETHWNGRTYSLTIENGAHFVILQTPVIVAK